MIGQRRRVTPIKRVEELVREGEHQFRQLTETLPQLVWTCTPKGDCDYLSPQFAAYTGVPTEEQLGSKWIQQVHPDDRASILAEWSSAVRSGTRFFLECRLRAGDGRYRWFECRASQLRNAENEVVKWVGTCTDINEARETRIALEQERTRLANLVALAPAVFCTFAWRPDGTSYFPYSGPAIADLFGVQPEDLTKDARRLFCVFQPDELAAIREALRHSADTATPWRSQFRIMPRSGCEKWIEAHANPTFERDGSIVWHGFFADITERKRAEAGQQFLLQLDTELQATGSALEIAQVATRLVADHFELARCSLSSVDIARSEATLVTQYTRKGRPATAGKHSLRTWMLEPVAEMFSSGTAVAIDDTSCHPFTAPLYAEAFQPAGIESLMAVPMRRGGQWLGLLCLFCAEPRCWTQADIDLARGAAERVWPAYEAARALESERAMHETLAASEQRLRLAVLASDIGIWEFNPVTLKRSWDARCRVIYGFPPDLELTPEVVMSCVHPEDCDAVEKAMADYLDPAGSGHFDLEYRITPWNSAGLRHVYARGLMMFEGEGSRKRPVRGLGTLEDITAMKQAEQALRRANQELEQFAYAAAHDLQEPLRNVRLATQLLASRFQGEFDDDTNALLEAAVEGPLRMQEMVKALLHYSRATVREDGVPSFADAEAVLATALKNLQAALREKVAQVSWDRLPTVRMSEMHLLQVLQNLIGNSLKYSGGKQPRIHVGCGLRQGEFALFVQDNGMGIPPEYHERVFRVFKRLHRDDVPGTGIGLSLCKRIVEHYGGRIWIESGAEEGTTIFFTPPIAGEFPKLDN